MADQKKMSGGAKATTYDWYVDSVNGNDSNSGKTQALALKTLATLAGKTITAGQRVGLKCGSKFREQFSVPWSGSANLPITIDNYGSGAKPMITTSVDLSATAAWGAAQGSSVTSGLAPAADSDDITAVTAWGDVYQMQQFGSFSDASMTPGVCIRFRNVTVPKGSPISSAVARLRATADKSGATVNLTVSGEKNASPAAFSTLANVAGRTHTDATVPWNNVEAWSNTQRYNSPNLSTIVEEICGLAAWASGHDLVLFFADNGSTLNASRAGNDYADYAPGVATLSITYGAPIPNVWVTAATIGLDVGSLIFNSEALIGSKKADLVSCTAQGDFYYDSGSQLLYLYSTSNPGTYYSAIEAALHQDGIYIDGKSYITIRDLDLRYCGKNGIEVNGYTTPFDNILIEHNNFSYIGGGYQTGTTREGNGIQFYSGGTNIIVRYNHIKQVYDAAMSTQGTEAGKTYTGHYYYYNLVENCEYGFEQFMTGAGSTTNGLYVYNNVFCNNGGGWSHAQRADPRGTGLMLWDSLNGGLSNCVFENNIIHTSANQHIYSYDPTNDLTGWTIDYNNYYQDGAAAFLRNATAANFAGWKTATSKDAHSIVTDPTFVSLVTPDFHLQAGSGCINAGVSVGLTTDYAGAAVGNPPEIGAYGAKAATVYYVDATLGNDANDGKSLAAPLKTVVAVNALALNPGESVLFKRGETWTGTRLVVPSSGTAGKPIVFSDYGTGALPILDGTGVTGAILASAKSYLTFWNLQCQQGTGACMTLGSHHVLVDSCTIISGGADNIMCSGPSAQVSYITIRNCISRNAGAMGIYIGNDLSADGPVGCLVELNTVYSNGTHVDADHGIYLRNTVQSIVRRNESYGNLAGGLKFNGGSLAQAYQNYIHGNKQGVILSAQGGLFLDNAQIYNNICVGNTETQLQFLGSVRNGLIYHNDFISNVTTTPTATIYFQTATNSGNAIENNIITGIEGKRCLRFVSTTERSGNGPYDYNQYYQTGGTTLVRVNTTDYTLATWQALDASLDPHSALSDPVFVTPYTDLHLQTTSPCKNAGADLRTTVPTDYDGVTRDATPDIGAYEF